MKIKALIGLIGFLGFPFLLHLFSGGLVMQEIAFWSLFGIIILWIHLVEKRSISSIGWRAISLKSVFAGFGLGILLFILFGLVTMVIQQMGLELNQDVAQLIASQPFAMLLLIALRAAIVEEVLYRGYAFERLLELTGSKWIAALIPVVIFTLAHLSWGAGHLVFVFFAGSLFMLVYMAKRSLPLIMFAHFTTDVFALLVLPLLLDS